MGDERPRAALLGRLASLGWFARRGEVAATQSLAFLLEEPGLREALVQHLGQLADVAIGEVMAFATELVHEDGARPDLEGLDVHRRPLVVIEAKFGAILSDSQLEAYISYQADRLTDGERGVLAVLVPSYRRPEAETVLSAVARTAAALSSPVATAVITWDELLEVCDHAAQQLREGERADVMGDLRQLRALCKTMVALDIPPLGLVASGSARQEREGDLRKLLHEATVGFPGPSGRVLPFGTESEFEYYRRYIPGGLEDTGCYLAVGVLSGAAGHGTPFWSRYSRATSSFQVVSQRIMASPLASDARGDGGHLWLPLHVSADRSGAVVVAELVEKIDAIRATASGTHSKPA